jgi:hypothetical protein
MRPGGGISKRRSAHDSQLGAERLTWAIEWFGAAATAHPNDSDERGAPLPERIQRGIFDFSTCLRKDLERRAQHADDIKLALEELREDSASGKLSRPSQAGGYGLATVDPKSFRIRAGCSSGVAAASDMSGYRDVPSPGDGRTP